MQVLTCFRKRNFIPFSTLKLSFCLLLSGCFALPFNTHYKGPEERSQALDQYYAVGNSYRSFREEAQREENQFTQKRIYLESDAGQITIDYFARKKKSDDLIFVFPMLGGRNQIENYFAEYFAKNGYDSAVVHRSNDFKKPENVDHLEEILRSTVVRDRIAMDFFEREYQKKDFGSFGISRGAINAATSAGVDKRLKYNVMALGASDLPSLMRETSQKGIKAYREKIMAEKNITQDQFYDLLENQIKTDPKWLASHIDARGTLLFLALFDSTVPFKYGMKLRKLIGKPKTVFLFADHYTSIAYTQYVSLIPPEPSIALFPFDYIESESLAFFNQSFKKKWFSWQGLPLRIIRTPIDLIAAALDKIF